MVLAYIHLSMLCLFVFPFGPTLQDYLRMAVERKSATGFAAPETLAVAWRTQLVAVCATDDAAEMTGQNYRCRIDLLIRASSSARYSEIRLRTAAVSARRRAVASRSRQ